MGVVALTGRDTHKINNRILNNFASGDCVVIEYDTELVQVKKGKNGNTIYALNENGKIAKATYRMIAGSADDRFMQALLTSQENDFPSFTLLVGESTKRLGDGEGNISPVPFFMTGGILRKKPGMKDNAEGDTEQAIVVYEVMYGNAQRTIG